MKKLLFISTIVGLVSSISLTAAPSQMELQAKTNTPHMQNLIQKYNTMFAVPVSPYTLPSFIAAQEAAINGAQTQLNTLLSTNGWLASYAETARFVTEAQTLLKQSKDDLARLKAVENVPQALANESARIPLLTQILETYSVPSTFPAACKDYQGKMVTGIIDKKPGSKGFAFHAIDPEAYYDFLEGNVGLYNNGKEYAISGTTPNGMLQGAYLGADPESGNTVVVCITNPYKPTGKQAARPAGR